MGERKHDGGEAARSDPPRRERLGRPDLLQQAQHLVQQRYELLEICSLPRSRVQEAGDGAKQIPQKIACAGFRCDVEVNLIKVDDQAKQVKVQRTKPQVQNFASETLSYVDDWDRDGTNKRGAGIGPCQGGTNDRSYRRKSTIDDPERPDRQRSDEVGSANRNRDTWASSGPLRGDGGNEHGKAQHQSG